MANILCLMTLLLAFLGMMYEYILAHYISSIIGGAYVILFVTFCLFAASLGLGSVAYNFVAERFKNLKSLGFVQIFITLMVLCLPFYFELLNDLYLHQGWTYFSVLIGASLPVVSLGVISGFELPLMFRLAYVNISRLLIWDYIGMFLGVTLFPFIFVFGLHVKIICFALAAVSAAMAAVCFLLYKKTDIANSVTTNSSSVLSATSTLKNFKLGMLLVFIMSFCSFAYQGLLGKVVVSIIGDKFASRTYAIGFFILGMALGAWFIERKERAGLVALKRILGVELIICALAAILPVALYFIAASWFVVFGLGTVSEEQLTWYGSIVLSLFPLLMGLFSGMELPLVFQWLGLNNEQKESYYLIAMNYLAAIFSGALIGFILPHFIGYSFSFLLIIMINMFVFFGIYFSFPNLKKTCYQIFLALIVLSFINIKLVYPSRQFFIESFYAKMHLNTFSIESLKTTLKAIKLSGDVFRIESFFQDIDIVNTENSSIESKEKLFYLYLNRQPQFNSETIVDYHQSMLWAGVDFLDKDPESILVLGGGDGLLASELVRHYPNTPITMVELDPTMIHLAKSNYRLQLLNENSLSNKNVEVLVEDAYQFVRRSEKKYDLVFVDFPYPVSIDLSRLYSHEFYSGVRQVLTSEGVLILDAPIITRFDEMGQQTLDPNTIKILSTIKAAGFTKPFVFGPYDPFVAVSKSNKELSFSQEVRAKVRNSVFTNLHSLEHALEDFEFDDPQDVNYVLKPTVWGME